MGAWGLGLFQSDNDYDIIDELTYQCGLDKLASDAAAAQSGQTATDKQETAGDTGNVNEDATSEPDSSIRYSLYANHNPSEDAIAVVRDYLNGGKLKEMVDKKNAELASNTDSYPPIPYVLCILGACAMSLGCNIYPSFKEQLKVIYINAGLMRDAKTQMKKALFGPNGYEYGKEYDFGAKGLHETMMSGGPADEDKLYPESKYGNGGVKLLNCQSPFGMGPLSPESIAELRRARHAESTQEQQQRQQYGADVCGGCGQGAEEAGKTLMQCGTCKRKYCGKACQKTDWKSHKAVCRAPEGVQA